MSRLVRAVDGTDAIPVLTIDSPSTLDWNPVRDITAQTITAKLMVGDTDVTATGQMQVLLVPSVVYGSAGGDNHRSG